MLNTLEDYIWRSLPDTGVFSTNPNLPKKVGEDGDFLPFYGNTTVFLLDGKTKAVLKKLQKEIYAQAGQILGQPLDGETFHMTLHDLVNAPVWSGELEASIEETARRAKPLLAQWKDQPPLRMHTTWLFNMVNTSVVLGLAPSDEDSLHRLDAMYCALENVVCLGYGLTPHITMGYYRPGTYTLRELAGLRQTLHPVQLDVELPMDALVYQNFRDMNHYF